MRQKGSGKTGCEKRELLDYGTDPFTQCGKRGEHHIFRPRLIHAFLPQVSLTFADTRLAPSQISRSCPFLLLHAEQSGTMYQFLSVALSFCTWPPTEWTVVHPFTKHLLATWPLNFDQCASQLPQLQLFCEVPFRFFTLMRPSFLFLLWTNVTVQAGGAHWRRQKPIVRLILVFLDRPCYRHCTSCSHRHPSCEQ